MKALLLVQKRFAHIECEQGGLWVRAERDIVLEAGQASHGHEQTTHTSSRHLLGTSSATSHVAGSGTSALAGTFSGELQHCLEAVLRFLRQHGLFYRLARR